MECGVGRCGELVKKIQPVRTFSWSKGRDLKHVKLAIVLVWAVFLGVGVRGVEIAGACTRISPSATTLAAGSSDKRAELSKDTVAPFASVSSGDVTSTFPSAVP